MRSFGMLLLLFGGGLASCSDGGGDGGGGGPNPISIAKAASSGDGQTGTVGTALADPFCASVTQDGAAKAGATVAWTTTSGGSMSPTSTASAADGSACSTLTLGQAAGAQTAQAALSGATGSPLTFNATADADIASTMTKEAGDGQHAEVNTPTDSPISVKITDQFGNPVGSVNVIWAVTPPGTAVVNPTSGNTAAGTGIASTAVTMGGTPGPIVITATSGTLTGSPQTFNLTADPPPPPPPAAITIAVVNNSFSPPVDTVAVGGTVTWEWDAGATSHTVTSTGSPSFVSDPAGIVGPPHTYGPITFNTAGTYFYYCEVHGSAGTPPTGMSGRIVVR